MKELNKLRMAAGLVIDPSIEITEKVQITEVREVPRRKADLRQIDAKSLKAKIRGLQHAVKHIQTAVTALEKVPATDFMGDVPRFVGELEDLLDAGGSTGMEAYLEHVASELRKLEGGEKQKIRKEEEEERYAELEASQEETPLDIEEPDSMKTEDEGIGAFIKNLSNDQREQLKIAMDALKKISDHTMPIPGAAKFGGGIIGEEAYHDAKDIVGEDRLEEAMHYYDVQYDGSHKANGDKPINVSDGSSNSEQIMDSLPATKKEGPEQLKTGETGEEKTNKPHDDLNTKIKVPNGIKQVLRTEIKKAKEESEKLDVRDKDASQFYKDLAQAFEDLLGHLEGGTRYDIKQAQIFAQTLMGPMLHKIPTEVWKFLTNGGETRSLKNYYQDVSKKYPITGPRNTLK